MPEELIDRRQAMSKLSLGALFVLGGSCVFVAGGFLYPIPKKKPPALFVCLEAQAPKAAGESLEILDPKGRKVLLMREIDGLLSAIETVCTHLGCAVFYRPDKDIFECPCHQGVFDAQGNPVSGPPETPLQRYPLEVRDGKVFIQFA
jgi:cytochrome b6-f complex iron-sulfur subunit